MRKGLESIMVVVFAAGCSGAGGGASGGSGSAQAFVVPEDTVTNGLDPGADLDKVQDGWTVRYDKFLAVVGNFRAARSASPGDKLSEPKVFVIDLLKAPQNGLSIAKFDGIAADRWDKVGYDMPKAAAGAVKPDFTVQADYDFMVKNGYAIYFEGHVDKPDGKSCADPKNPMMCKAEPKVTFKWGLAIGTSYDDCAPPSGAAGFAVPTGGTAQVKPTIHGDHWFFSTIPHGSDEITKRLAQWIANADLDQNGETTIDELKKIKASDIFPAATYNLTGGLVPVNTAYDYLEAEARSIGHFQGDGDCATRAIIK